MFGVKRNLLDGSNSAGSPAFDRSLHNFKDTKRERNLTFDGTFLGGEYKSYLDSSHAAFL